MLSACGAVLFIYQFDQIISAGLRCDWRRSNTTAHVDSRQTHTCLRVLITLTHTHTPCSVRAHGDARRGPSKDADCWQRVRTDRRAGKRSWNFPSGRLVRPVFPQKSVCVWALIHTRCCFWIDTNFFAICSAHYRACWCASKSNREPSCSRFTSTNISCCPASLVPPHDDSEWSVSLWLAPSRGRRRSPHQQLWPAAVTGLLTATVASFVLICRSSRFCCDLSIASTPAVR